MKKIFSFVVIFMMAILLVSCGNNKRIEPEITGVKSNEEITLGESIDLLSGVKGLENGKDDVTKNIKIEISPSSYKLDGSNLTPEEDGSYLIKYTLKDSKKETLVTTATLFLEVLPNLEVSEVSRVTYDFTSLDETAANGVTFKENGEVVNTLDVIQSNLIYKASKQANVVLNKNIKLVKDNEYLIKVTLKSSSNMSNLSLAILNDLENIPYLEVNNLELNNEFTTFEIIVTVNADNENGLISLNFGSLEKDTVITLKDIQITVSKNPNTEGLSFNSLVHEDNDWKYFNDSGESTATIIDENKIEINVSEYSGKIWEQKLFKENITLNANKNYKLEYTITSNKNLNYEYIARATSMQQNGRDENYIWSGPFVGENETKIMKHDFKTTDTDLENFEMFFQLGQAETGTKITISNMKLVSYDNFETTEIKFTGLPKGFDSYEHEGEAEANMYIDLENGKLVYDVIKFGTADWYNKVFIEDITFEEDAKYQVEFKVKSSKTIEAFFAINPMGEWNPKVTEMLEISTEYEVFNFETSSLQSFSQKNGNIIPIWKFQ